MFSGGVGVRVEQRRWGWFVLSGGVLDCVDLLLRRLAPQASLAGRTAMRRKREGRWGEVPKSGYGTPTYPTS